MTMRTLVVYESMFGNTANIAHAIGAELSAYGDVRVLEVGEAPLSLDGVDLLVVGGPTHAFGMTRPSTRADAQKQRAEPVVSRRRGVREWLAVLAKTASVPVAAFDTKVHKARKLPGAARAAAKALRRVGHPTVAPPESFYVDDTLGPLLDGELDRATAWAASLARGSARASVN